MTSALLHGRSPAVPTGLLQVAAAALEGAAAWLTVARESPAAGIAAAGAALLLIISATAARGSGGFAGFLDPLLDRAFDASVLGAIAWAARGTDGPAAAASLVALGGGFVGAYVTARGRALGYELGSSPLTRMVRYALVCGALAWGYPAGAMWGVAALTVLTALVRAGQVAKEERV